MDIPRSRTDKKYADIKADYEKLISVKEFGVQKNSSDWVLNKIAEKYYMSPKTIENIVFNRVAR